MMKLRDYLILLILIVVFTYFRFFLNGIDSDLNKPLVIMFETDLKHPNLKILKESLKTNGYEFKVITERKWVGFGRKIQKIKGFLSKLPREKIVIVCDARDVISVNFNSEQFMAKLKQSVDYDFRVLVSTEIGCCVRTAFGPGEYRTTTGEVIHRSFDEKTSKNNFDTKWKEMFKWRASNRGIKHPIEHKQSIYLNAGIYTGKVKNINRIYNYMAIHEKEDDQLIMSEIFNLHPNLFELDYNREFFSNSHVWDKNNKATGAEDSGCYYEKKDGKIIDTYLNSKPFFIHTPGKHFNCYDYVRKLS